MRKLLTLLFICVNAYSWSQSQAICGSGSSATLIPTNPQNLTNPQYSMMPGGVSAITPTSGSPYFSVSPITTSNFTIYTTGTGTNGPQTTSAVVTVTVFPKPNTNPVLFQPSCTSTIVGFNLGLTFSPASPAPSYTIAWSSIPNNVLSGQQTSVATGVSPGTYGYTITAQPGGCVHISSITLNPPPAPAVYTLSPFGLTQTLTCTNPTIDISASEPSYSYTWSASSSSPVISQSINLNSTNLGTWTVIGVNPVSNCTKTYTFSLIQNTITPSSTITPDFQNITCSFTSVTTVSVFANPTVNISHFIYDPTGGTFAANSHTAIYIPQGSGNYTHCLVNLENGCSTCKVFTVTSTQGFPTFKLQSSAGEYTLGCASKSIITISVLNGSTQPTPGGPISYTALAPGMSTVLPAPPSPLSSNSNYTVNAPGTWTFVVRDNTSFCERWSQQSVIQDIAPPAIVSTTEYTLLSCDHPTTVLHGTSETPNTSFNWAFVGVPGNVPGATVTVLSLTNAPTTTLVNTYTLTVTNTNNACKSTSVIPIYQNLFKPKVGFSLGTASITCKVPTIVLTNTSSTSIPPQFQPFQPVIGFLWRGPTPQQDLPISTTYVAATQGVYTLTGKDLNNGCVNTGTMMIEDARDYPTILISTKPGHGILDCGSAFTTLSISVNPSASMSYSWTVPPASVVGPQTLTTLDVRAVGVFSVLVTNTVNFCPSAATINVVTGSLTANFAADYTAGVAPLTVKFINNSSSSVGNNSITTVWSFGQGDTTITKSTSVTPKTITYTQPGTYSVGINALKGACTATFSQLIEVEIPSQVVIPNIFTPNGDNINDLFFVKASNMAEITFMIFDRWGQLVYELTSGSGNIAWDGKNQTGVDAAEGVYFYVLTGRGKDGQLYDKKGNITLVR